MNNNEAEVVNEIEKLTRHVYFSSEEEKAICSKLIRRVPEVYFGHGYVYQQNASKLDTIQNVKR